MPPVRAGSAFAVSSDPQSRADARETLASTAELLSLGGDHRILLEGEARQNKYGCAPEPDPDLLAFGSSTASTISAAAFDAADALRLRLVRQLAKAPPAEVYQRELARIREELLQLCGLDGRGVQVVMAPSGTDLHLFAGQLAGGHPERPALAIIAEETETGSGVPAALAGRRFSPITPFEDTSLGGELICGAPCVKVMSVAARGEDGRPRDEAAVDAEVTAVAEKAVERARGVLLVLTDVSKTGLVSPSPACARRLAARFPGQVTVLVDACQLRLSPSTLRAYADEGWMIAVTGSKFLTGPAFSGALFAPQLLAESLSRRVLPARLRAFSARADWPDGWAARMQLAPAANPGLLLRWEAALEELRRFRRVPEAKRKAFVSTFGRTAAEAIAASPALEPLEIRALDRGLGDRESWDRLATIIPFLLKRPSTDGAAAWLTRAQTEKTYRLLRQDLSLHAADVRDPGIRRAAGLRIEVGQPVAAGVRDGTPVSALRLCASARLISDACSGDPRAAARVLAEGRLALTKAAWLAGEVAAGRL